jgi:ankyrin repeat protein
MQIFLILIQICYWIILRTTLREFTMALTVIDEYMYTDNDSQAIMEHLDNGADINAIFSGGNTGLHIVCGKLNIELARQLVNRGANINIKNNDGDTPLHILCGSYMEVSVLEDFIFELLSKFDYIDDENIDGLTLLHLACYNPYHNINIIRELVRKTFNIYTVDYEGNTPLHILCDNNEENNFSEIIIQLIEKDADINIKNNDGNTPLHILCSNPSNEFDIVIKLLELFERCDDINAENDNGETLLQLACKDVCNNFIVIQELVHKITNINTIDSRGNTPLHILCHADIPTYFSDEDCLKDTIIKLIERGADINSTDSVGNTPLHILCNNHLPDYDCYSNKIYFKDAIIKLIERGADIGAVDFSQIIDIDRRERMIEICERARRNKIRRKIVQMRFVANYWRKIRDREQINAGAIIVG